MFEQTVQPISPRSRTPIFFEAQIQSRTAQIPSLHFFPISDSLSYVRSRNEEPVQLPNTSSRLVGAGSYQRWYPDHRAPSQVAGFKRLVLSCDVYPKTDLVAFILYDLAKSHQIYPMPTDNAIFQYITPDLTDSLVMRPLDYRDVICNFSQCCFLRPGLKVFHFQDYNSHL
jgi:hypothetical protein